MTRAGLKLFMFKSGAKPGLFSFAADGRGTKLPERLGPWTSYGVVRPEERPPHGMSRNAIEAGISEHGFQLWRKKEAAPTTG
ncbi:hypothetical protein BN1110_03829 [bacterium YEK0313]|nr:hypothetical protein BN1110_03829 [bacterium YEK0313]